MEFCGVTSAGALKCARLEFSGCREALAAGLEGLPGFHTTAQEPKCRVVRRLSSGNGVQGSGFWVQFRFLGRQAGQYRNKVKREMSKTKKSEAKEEKRKRERRNRANTICSTSANYFRLRPIETSANFDFGQFWMLNFGTTKCGALEGLGPRRVFVAVVIRVATTCQQHAGLKLQRLQLRSVVGTSGMPVEAAWIVAMRLAFSLEPAIQLLVGFWGGGGGGGGLPPLAPLQQVETILQLHSRVDFTCMAFMRTSCGAGQTFFTLSTTKSCPTFLPRVWWPGIELS